MAQFIYSRVSTDKQETSNQLAQLRDAYPTASVVEEVASGSKNRPMLTQLVASLQKGDVLIVAALDRLGRRTSEILTLIEDLERRGIILKSIREGVDYSTIAGRLVTQILVSVAEMERRLISERTKVALAAKRKQGIVGGRPRLYDDKTVAEIKDLKAQGYTCREIAQMKSLSPAHVSRLTQTSKTA